MRRFIKTSVAAEGYADVTRLGGRYVVHLDPVKDGEDCVVCYETTTDGEPDMEVLAGELAEWKAYIAGRELATARAAKIAELEAYDRSDAVNGFEFGGVAMWLDKATRAGLLLRMQAEQAAGIETTTLWYGVRSFDVPIGQAFGLLYAIEVYASQCYDRTAAHKAAIESLQTREEVEGYDFTAGYPPKLSF